MDFLAVKVDGSDVKSGICEEVFNNTSDNTSNTSEHE